MVGRPRGFAALSPERRREISSAAGKRAHELGVAHRWSPEEAAAASSRGWKKAPKRRRQRRKPAPADPPPPVEAPEGAEES